MDRAKAIPFYTWSYTCESDVVIHRYKKETSKVSFIFYNDNTILPNNGLSRLGSSIL